MCVEDSAGPVTSSAYTPLQDARTTSQTTCLYRGATLREGVLAIAAGGGARWRPGGQTDFQRQEGDHRRNLNQINRHPATRPRGETAKFLAIAIEVRDQQSRWHRSERSFRTNQGSEVVRIWRLRGSEVGGEKLRGLQWKTISRTEALQYLLAPDHIRQIQCVRTRPGGGAEVGGPETC